MPAVSLAPTAGILYQAFTVGGIPLNAGLLYTYAAGTTTPVATYTTSAGNVQNANPIVLGADGRPPSEVWLIDGTAYRFDLKDSADNLIASFDNITAIPAGIATTYLPLAGGTMTGLLTVPDAFLNIVGSGDPTKIAVFEVDGISAGTTRTYTVPNASGTLVLDGTKTPTRQVFTSGTAATYTTPAGCTAINVRCVGPGGGGGAQNTNAGSNGSAATTFSGGTMSAGAGAGGGAGSAAGGNGGAASGGDINIAGGKGNIGVTGANAAVHVGPGGSGASSFFGGAGSGGDNGGTGGTAATNSGSGGGGGGPSGGTASGSGGGAGGYCEKLISSPAATYTYTVGTGGAGGSAGGTAGGAGAAGIIIVDEYYT